MKYLFLIFSIFFLSFGSSFAELSENQKYQACFSQKASFQVSPVNNTLLLETNNTRLAVYQNDTKLQLLSYNAAYSYIPFSTNIEQTPKKWVLNRYSFEDIDTNTTKEILIELWEYQSSQNYILNLNHSSKNYRAEFYISEDWEKYDYVGPEDIGEKWIHDFKKKYIKIQFQSSNKEGEQAPRELIKIYDLSIKRNNNVLGIENVNPWMITVYGGISWCKYKWDIFSKENTRTTPAIGSPMYYIDSLFQENTIHTQKMTDSDGDGVQDLYDNCKTVKNADQKDINQNAVGDACEFDSDWDTIPDEIDNCRNIANTDQADDDKDGIGNSCDNCKLYNPSQKDEDWNKIWDSCDQQESFLEDHDDDKDGVLNSLDNCQSIANPDQADDDKDGVGNSCDNCKLFQNFDQIDKNENGVWDICEDSDNDGIEGIQDNCINIPNPDQADDDNDGIGNLCEDDDNDSVLFSLDNCPYIYNPDQLDTDKDGLGNICDEDDNRFLESNKNIFIFLMLLVIAGFIWAIFMMMKKLKK